MTQNQEEIASPSSSGTSNKKEKELYLKQCKESMDEVHNAVKELEQEFKLTKNEKIVAAIVSFVAGILISAFIGFMGFLLGSLAGPTGGICGAVVGGLLGSLGGFGVYAKIRDSFIENDEVKSNLIKYSIFAKQVINETNEKITTFHKGMLVQETNYVEHSYI